jgi:predicted GTPase
MGPTGCGKSTVWSVLLIVFPCLLFLSSAQFIAAASDKGHDAINHGQASAASGVRTIRAAHPKDGHPVVFVDTPGFDDTYVPDTETLQKIADWLVKTCVHCIEGLCHH